MRLGIGLVIKGGDEFIDKRLKWVERIGDIFLIIDNGTSKETKEKLLNHPKTKQYHIQKNMGRNQSRDYQKILEMAREEDIDWVWNIDIDEIIPEINFPSFEVYLLNSLDESIGFPLFEMRGEDNYIMIMDAENNLKQARGCHKCYKVLSHLKFNEKDIHGNSVPHNTHTGDYINIPIQHFGHSTKELREENEEFKWFRLSFEKYNG